MDNETIVRIMLVVWWSGVFVGVSNNKDIEGWQRQAVRATAMLGCMVAIVSQWVRG